MKENRENFRNKMESQIRELDAEIAGLKKQISGLKKSQKRSEVESMMDALQEKRENLRDRMDEMMASGEHAWKEFSRGVENAFSDLKNGFNRARSAFK